MSKKYPTTMPRKTQRKIIRLISETIRFDRQYPAESLREAEELFDAHCERQKKINYWWVCSKQEHELHLLISAANVTLAEWYEHNSTKRRLDVTESHVRVAEKENCLLRDFNQQLREQLEEKAK